MSIIDPIRSLYCLVFLLLDLCVLLAYAFLMIWRRITSCFLFQQNVNIRDKYLSCEKPVVFLIHGSGADSRQFILAKRILSECTWMNVESIDLPSHDLHIEAFAQEVAERIAYLGIRQVIFVGVSMGGLVASYFTHCIAPLLENHVQVCGIVTIGTPHQGAPALDYLLPLMNTKRHAQMKPNSSFLLKLAEKQRQDASVCPYLTIGSLSDLHVPNEYAQFSAPSTHRLSSHVTLEGPGHIALTVYPKIFYLVRQFCTNVYVESLLRTNNIQQSQ